MVNIKVLRENALMTQAQLAAKVYVDRSAVAKWETGAACPSTDKLPVIAKALGCKIDDLFSTDAA